MTIRFSQSQVHTLGRGSDSAAENLPGVHQKLTKGIGSLLRWRKGFARRFAEGIGKLVGNTPEDRRKKTGRLTTRMSEATGLARVRS
ncbi:hypothetical protein BHM03_00024379 [Ensete ventricosum]|nr:hypothetical protein BHM03_00024379 [Ensete ventricosum]